MPDPTTAVRALGAAPTPTAPTGGAVAPLDAVTFRWSAPPGAHAFDLRVASASAPGTPLVELDGLESTEATLSDVLPPGDALWWVRQTGGAWSAPSAFRAGTAADIEAARAADAEVSRARRDAETSARREPAALGEAPPDPVWPFAEGEALPGALPVDWSDVPGFTTPVRASAPPSTAAAPRPIAPLGGVVLDAVAVALRWASVPGATGYDVELSPDAAFARDVLALDAGAATEIGLAGLVPPAGHRVLWHVRARLGDAATPWSAYGRFYPAGLAAADTFQSGLDTARAARRRQREYARTATARDLDMVPLHARNDVAANDRVAFAIAAMAATSTVILLAAAVWMMVAL